MEISINLDFDIEAGNLWLLSQDLRKNAISYFLPRAYGEGIHKIGLILNCRPSYLNHKLRKRFDKKEKILYLDVMNNFEKMCTLTDPAKIKYLKENLKDSIEHVLNYKMKISDFDFNEFAADWRFYFSN